MDIPDITESIYYEDPNLNILLSRLEPLNTQASSKGDVFTNKDIQHCTQPHYLQVEDNSLSLEVIEELYLKAKEEIKDKVHSLERELKDCNLALPPFEMIYKAKDIKSAVEQTYNYDFQLKKQMIEEISNLKTIASVWRRVSNDGNCFYRCAVFLWLENAVLNNRVSAFKKVIADLKLKFNPSYPNTTKLPQATQKDLYSIANNISITIMILECIIIQLENSDKDLAERIKAAYIILIKSFNFCKRFDTTMIYYLRYLLYEFILENEDRTYSIDYPVKLSKLLPSHYQLGEGKSLFDKYFEEELLRFYTQADKLAIYLTPLVLRVGLKVIQYNYGNECSIQAKCFPYLLPDRECIVMLSRKTHYDICYSGDYMSLHGEVIREYYDNGKEASVVEEEDVKEYQCHMKEVDLNGEVLYEKKKEVDPESEIMQQLNKMRKRMAQYRKCSLCSQVITDLESKVITLPCKCEVVICNELCQNSFVKAVITAIETDLIDPQFKCPLCSVAFAKDKFFGLALTLSSSFNKSLVTISLQTALKQLYDTHCMMCLHKFEEKDKKLKVKVKSPFFLSIFSTNKCEHLLCKQCLNKQPLVCLICSCYHFRLMDK